MKQISEDRLDNVGTVLMYASLLPPSLLFEKVSLLTTFLAS